MVYNVSKNNGSVYNLGNDPSVNLLGVTYQRVFLKGTGVLTLDLSNVVIKDTYSLLIQGFNKVIIENGNLEGGIRGINNKSYEIKNTTIVGGEVALLIGNECKVQNLELENVYIIGAEKGIVLGGQLNGYHPAFDRVYLEQVFISRVAGHGLSVHDTEWLFLTDCIISTIREKNYGKARDLHLDTVGEVKLRNCQYKTLRNINSSDLIIE